MGASEGGGPPRTSGSTSVVTVLIADDDDTIREVLSELVSTDPSLRLIGASSDPPSALELARRHQPDVALVDVRMPRGGGAGLVRQLRTCSPGTRCVAFTAYGDRRAVVEMVGAGVVGYLVKGAPAEEVLDAIHSAVQGRARLSDEATAEVVSELASRVERQELSDDAQRERLRRVEATLAGGAIEVVFQPIVVLRNGATAGYEALARFGSVANATATRFSEARNVGLLTALEVAAARAALASLDLIPDDAHLAINLSPQTVVEPDVATMLAPLPVHRIVLELTEHAPVEDYHALAEVMWPLRERGLRVAVDDAGAGYASLKHLLALDPDIIKLDVSLTRHIHADPRRRALAEALIAFAAATDATITAEGIELEAELKLLRQLGVAHGQGFLLGRPARLDRDHQPQRR